MESSARVVSTISNISLGKKYSRNVKPSKHQNVLHFPRSRHLGSCHYGVFCISPPWDSSPTNDIPKTTTLAEAPNIFEALVAESSAETTGISRAEPAPASKEKSALQVMFLKWPMWLLGPGLLLTTGMVPTLWLPLSSVFLGPSIASLLSLVGLDCLFNLGVTLFLLMADSNARPNLSRKSHQSEAPFSYQLCNLLAAIIGFVIPMMMLCGPQKGSLSFLLPQMSFISFAVLLGPYLLLLTVQVVTEMLTWHWRSPVWLVTPVVYESYRVLQLMRALTLGAEMNSPGWIMNIIRGLVCWWVFILAVQLMRVAWFAGFSVRNHDREELEPFPAHG